MADKKQVAQEIVDKMAVLFGVEKTKMTSELAEGTYTLEDGTTFRIDAEGNLVDVVAPDAEAAAAEEARKLEEDQIQMAAQKKIADDLKTANAKIEELEAEVLKLSKAPKFVPTPTPKKKYEPIQLTANMTYAERVAARTRNMLNSQNQ